MPPKPKIVPVTPEERLGYEIPGPTGRRGAYGGAIAISPGDLVVERPAWWHTIRFEERFGLILFAVGLFLTVKANALVISWAGVQQLLSSRPSAQLALLGLLIWLHAKWRRATRVV